MNTNFSAIAVANATLNIQGDVIIIGDRENTLHLTRDAAIELWKRLPDLISKLPSNMAAICETIVNECEESEKTVPTESEKLWMRAYASGARRMLHELMADNTKSFLTKI